jgi:hypothetical protein
MHFVRRVAAQARGFDKLFGVLRPGELLDRIDDPQLRKTLRREPAMGPLASANLKGSKHPEPAATRVAALLAQAACKPDDHEVAPAARNVLAR